MSGPKVLELTEGEARAVLDAIELAEGIYSWWLNSRHANDTEKRFASERLVDLLGVRRRLSA